MGIGVQGWVSMLCSGGWVRAYGGGGTQGWLGIGMQRVGGY